MRLEKRMLRSIAILAATAGAAPAATFNRVALTGITGAGGPNQGSGVTFSSLDNPFINNNNQVVFRGTLTGTGVNSNNNQGYWIGLAGGNLTLVTRMGNDAPGISGDAVISQIRHEIALGRQNSNFGYLGLLSGTGIDGSNDAVIFCGMLGNTPVARENTQAPSLPPGVVFSAPAYNPAPTEAFHPPRMNENGVFTFFATLRSTSPFFPIDNFNRDTIWYGYPAGTISLLARGGMPAPGTGTPAANFYFLEDPVINNTGLVAFRASLTGNGVTSDNSSAIFVGLPNALQMVVRRGTQAPFLPNGVKIRFGEGTEPRKILFNDKGTVVFYAYLYGPGVDNTNSRALYMVRNGTLQMIARQGLPAPGTDGTWAGLNEPVLNGQDKVAFMANLTGNTNGIWVGDPMNLHCAARSGQQAPGLPAGVTYRWLGLPAINGLGQIAFTAELAGPGVTVDNNYALFAGYPGNLECVLRKGQYFDVNPTAVVDYRVISNIQISSPSSGEENGTPFQLNDNGVLAFRLRFTDNSYAVYTATIPTCSGTIAPDLNGDCHVDQADFEAFNACRTGPGVPYTVMALPAGCYFIPNANGRIQPDFDQDGDVDMDDFGKLQRCMTGPTYSVDPTCVN